MKLDLDPERNRRQLEKVRTFTSRYSVMDKKWFYYLSGMLSIFSGITFLFIDPAAFSTPIDRPSQLKLGFSCLGLGSAILIVTHVVSKLWIKVGEYEPKENTGDEWHQ